MRQVPLRVITVHQPVVDYWGALVTDPEDDYVSGPARKAARAQTDKVLSALGEQPPEVSVEATFGSPALELLRTAEEADADLLVVGSRGAGGFTRLLMGSVSSQVTHHASCPVTVIPPLTRE
jgi:nucleotide-binding universal stress UspA family protein